MTLDKQKSYAKKKKKKQGRQLIHYDTPNGVCELICSQKRKIVQSYYFEFLLVCFRVTYWYDSSGTGKNDDCPIKSANEFTRRRKATYEEKYLF